MTDAVPADSELLVKVRDTDASFRRTRVPDGPDKVVGKFWFDIDLSALNADLYVPSSVSSGKKPTGFVYQLEGTVPGMIATTDIECRGAGITQITLGTIIYTKIPKGGTASFRIRIEMRGQVGKSYGARIRQIHYKRDPGDARYQKVPQDIGMKLLRFA